MAAKRARRDAAELVPTAAARDALGLPRYAVEMVLRYLDVRSLAANACTNSAARAAVPAAVDGQRLILLYSRYWWTPARLKAFAAAPHQPWSLAAGLVLPSFNGPHERISKPIIGALAHSMPRIKFLDTTQMGLVRSQLVDFCRGFRYLTVLRFGNARAFTLHMVAHLPLRVLELYEADSVHCTDRGQWACLDSMPALEVLELPVGWFGDAKRREPGAEPPLTDAGCLAHLRSLPKLWRLNLSRVWSLGDAELDVLGSLRLRELILQDMGPGCSVQGFSCLAHGALAVLDLRGNFWRDPQDEHDPASRCGGYVRLQVPKLKEADGVAAFEKLSDLATGQGPDVRIAWPGQTPDNFSRLDSGCTDWVAGPGSVQAVENVNNSYGLNPDQVQHSLRPWVARRNYNGST